MKYQIKAKFEFKEGVDQEMQVTAFKQHALNQLAAEAIYGKVKMKETIAKDGAEIEASVYLINEDQFKEIMEIVKSVTTEKNKAKMSGVRQLLAVE